MSILQAIVLGVIQGLTEFLPVSSSGHLLLIPKLFGWSEQGVVFDAMIHVATLGAVFFGLFGDIRNIAGGMLKGRKPDAWGRLGWIIVLGTLPTVAAGLLFKDFIENVLRSPIIVVVSLAFWGIVLAIADRKLSRRTESNITKVGWRRALAIGAAQAIALIPGTSRSGITITAGLFGGLSRDVAARFSFLLGIPAIAAAGSLAILEVFQGKAEFELVPLIVGFICAFASGLVAVKLLLKLMRKASYLWFAVYRVALAVVVLLVWVL